MNYDCEQIARIRQKIFNSTEPNSPERERMMGKLSEPDLEALYRLDMDIRTGRIKESEVREMAAERDYSWYKKKMDEADTGNMGIISKFALDCPELYQQYRKRYQQEQSEEIRLRNRKMDENPHKNKPCSSGQWKGWGNH